MNLILQENPQYVRDSSTKAIINVDSESYMIAINRKKNTADQANRIQELQQQLDELLQWKEQIITLLQNKSE